MSVSREKIAKHVGQEVLANPKIIKVLHGCIFSDLWWLARDFGAILSPVFDT
jgi:ribonuclease D